MATIYIDNVPYQVEEGRNLLHDLLAMGFNMPYFCWHPALGSVGACRQCAVKQFKDEHDTKGRLVMACMTPSEDGSRFSIEDPEAVNFRAGVIEWLMTNHPHDCPVCDEGGECHLQDMTVMTGHNYRRFAFKKRTFRNQDLGPFINHEMNRCITCYRCVRFYRDYAGGKDLDAFAAHNHVYFGRLTDGTLESPFSGNLVEVCPTGVFTDKTLKMHYTRKWDLQNAPSVCHHCSLGCNTIAGERYGSLRRILNRYNGEVNGYFLCDRGRFGYEFVNSASRLRQIHRRSGGETGSLSQEDLPGLLETILSGGPLVGIGSPRASLESNFALRNLVGQDHFFAGVAGGEMTSLSAALRVLSSGAAHSATLQEVGRADAVLVLGEDVSGTAPMADLALRQASRQAPQRAAEALKIPAWNDAAVREVIQDERGPVCIATPRHTVLDEIARWTLRGGPDDLVQFGQHVLAALETSQEDDAGRDGEAIEVARALFSAERPLVVAGTGLNDPRLIDLAGRIAGKLAEGNDRARIFLVVPECNSLGMALLTARGIDQAMDREKGGTLIVLENDLYRRATEEAVDQFLEGFDRVLVLDCLPTRTTEKASLVFPSATFAEGTGTLVNNEGRAQRYFRVMEPAQDVLESWRWIRHLLVSLKKISDDGWETLDDLHRVMGEADEVLEPVARAAPPADFRRAHEKIPREPHRYSGRTAMSAQENVHEQRPPDDKDAPLAHSMEGFPGVPPAALTPFYWRAAWNSVQATKDYITEPPPGVRLIGPGRGNAQAGSDRAETFQPRKGEWLLLPEYHVFGSDELSARSPAIARRAPSPYLRLGREDAASLSLGEGEQVFVRTEGTEHHLPVVIDATLPAGLAGYPVGLPGSAMVELPAWVRIGKGGP